MAPHPADLTCPPVGRVRATVLLFHPGGFIGGAGKDMVRECQTFARHGYLAVSIDYSHKLGAAMREATSRARRLRRSAHRAHRPIFAFGFSAGGTFAATLAARGEVDAAYAYAGIYDIAAWVHGSPPYIKKMGSTPAEVARLSPVNAPLRKPSLLLIDHNTHDIVAPYRAARRMARRSRSFVLHTRRRPTNGYAAHIAHPIRPALAFFGLIHLAH
jgi:hypothetical protein